MEEINLKPIGGLCNRLRVVLSYKYEYPNKKINVYWIVNTACPGFFLDYFEPIENFEFFKSIPKDVKILKEHISCGGSKSYINSVNNEEIVKCIFSNLVLKQELHDKINKIIKNFYNDKFIACHVRRTDHSIAFKKESRLTKDETFFDFLTKNNGNIYLATDNLETQKLFYEKFKDRITYIKFIKPSKNIRQTTIEDSIVDIYICAHANKFQGSFYSSYSGFIHRLQKYLKL